MKYNIYFQDIIIILLSLSLVVILTPIIRSFKFAFKMFYRIGG